MLRGDHLPKTRHVWRSCGKWAQARLLHGFCALQLVHLLGGGEIASENGGVGVTVKYKYI